MSERGARLLGLGVRAGAVVVGVAGVRAGLQRGDVALVVVPEGHTERTADKVVRLARGKNVPVLLASSGASLGHAVGRGAVQAVGVQDAQLASGLLGRP